MRSLSLSLFFSFLAFAAFLSPAFAETKAKSDEADKCFTDNSGGRVCAGQPINSLVKFSLNFAQRKIRARAILDFKVPSPAAKVFFFFDPLISRASLDGKTIRPERQKAPGNEDQIIVLPVAGKERYQLVLDYEIKQLSRWGFNWSPFHWQTDFSDSGDARFINAFAPASFEAFRYPMTFVFDFQGLKQKLSLFSSASEINRPGKNIYSLNFARWNNLAGPFFEFNVKTYRQHSFNYKGLYDSIPVTVYFNPGLGKAKGLTDRQLARQVENWVRRTIDKFESTIGRYSFDKLLLKLYSLQEGDLPLNQEYSMEYSGAVVSRLELIPHEICHQWFARGASPRDGQAGFADELICDWYDYNNPVSSPAVLRTPVRLSSDNPFTLRTPEESYQEGLFLAGLAYLYKKKGLDIYTVLRRFYQDFRLASYSREDFLNYLASDYPGDLHPYFQRYIYGSARTYSFPD